MAAFLALLLKEFTLRRKSCCAIFVHLILPFVVIFGQVGWEFLNPTLKPALVDGSENGYLFAPDNGTDFNCYNYSDDFQTTMYVNGIDMKGEYDSESRCSFSADRCPLGIEWKSASFEKANAQQELIDATNNKALNDLCKTFKPKVIYECEDIDEKNVGLVMDKNGNILNLTYYIGHEMDSRKDEGLTLNLQIFHFAVLAKAYLTLRGRDEDKTPPYNVFLSFSEEDKAFSDIKDTEDNRNKMSLLTGQRTDLLVVHFNTMMSLIVLIRHILYEKRSKIKDLMHMSGVGNFKYYASYFVIDVVIVLIWNFMQLLYNSTATLEYYVITGVYSVAVTLFAIAFTVFFTKPLLGLVIFTLLLAVDFIAYTQQFSHYVQLLLSIYPFLGLKAGFEQLDNRKEPAKRLNHLQLFKFDWNNNPKILQPQFVLIVMIVSWFFYNFVIFYIGEIWPWQSGTVRSPLFPLAKLNKSLKSKRMAPDKNAGSPEFEPEPKDLKVGIEVNNIRKRYGSTKIVLKGVFLKVFHGQISVLLGHNGAGKTTLISIITGIDSATSGKVLINGIDVDYEPTKARSGIGMCPQINSQYDSMTVWEHFKLFGMLKGFPLSKLNQEIKRVLDLVKLSDAEDRNSKALSGGMKRRLQLGMAFIGGSRILILDEPSSGLDVEARRVVWDMLLAVKREYLIFMTTHHMEEADCLGDRVIIMHDGEIRCIGSPMFLKNVYGGGLTLRVSKGDNFQYKACLDFMQQYLKSAKAKKETRTEVLYVISKTEQSKLGQFFRDLDSMRGKLGISSCGVAITTMDDVFVRVGEMYDVKKGSQATPMLTIENGQKILKPTFCKAFYGLLVKRFHVLKRSKLFYVLLVMSLLYSIFFIVVFDQSSFQVKGYNASFTLGEKFGYTCLPKDSEICKDTFKDSLNKESEQSAFTIEVMRAPVKIDSRIQIPGCLLLTPKRGQELAAMTEAFQMLIKAKINSEIEVHSQIEVSKRMVHYPKVEDISPLIVIVWGTLLLIIPFRAVHAEKWTNIKLLQLMTGVSPVSYWLSHLVFDFLVTLVIASPLILYQPIFYIVGYGLVFNELSSAILYHVGVFYLIFSCIIWSYIVSTLPVGPAAGIQLLIYYCFLGYIPGQILVLSFTSLTYNMGFPISLISYPLLLIYWLLRISPLSQFEQILISVIEFSDKSAFCKNLFETFPKNYVCKEVKWKKLRNNCCNGLDFGEPWKNVFNVKNGMIERLKDDYDVSHLYPTALGFIVLVLFTILVFALDYIIIAKRKKRNQVQHSVIDADVDVYNERMATEAVLAANGQVNKALVVRDLTKQYGKTFVVNRLTVTVEKNQIFGFLGVNGAGKTTAFKMMVGEINRTGGEAYIEQYSLSINFQKYRAQIGYCPQFDAFVTGLTGMEMLYLFARLRGIQKPQLKQTVDQMISLVDLQDYARVVADNYSGGNKRKLAAAIALIGFPKVILLDEPTAAVDPVARRMIWKVMEFARQKTGSSIVLTSHALDECEALCEKIVVMVAGQLKCLGSLQHLKGKFGQGLHITAKTKPGYNNLPQVEEAIMRMVPSAKVVDSHTNVAILHVTDPHVQIGDVYGSMEQIKAQFDLEDYQVEETNLEQIFLYFAKAAYK